MSVDYAVESDGAADLHIHVDRPHVAYVKHVDPSGGIHLFPLDHLDPEEQAVFRDPKLLADTIEGLREYASGESEDMDWVFGA